MHDGFLRRRQAVVLERRPGHGPGTRASRCPTCRMEGAATCGAAVARRKDLQPGAARIPHLTQQQRTQQRRTHTHVLSLARAQSKVRRSTLQGLSRSSRGILTAVHVDHTAQPVRAASCTLRRLNTSSSSPAQWPDPPLQSSRCCCSWWPTKRSRTQREVDASTGPRSSITLRRTVSCASRARRRDALDPCVVSRARPPPAQPLFGRRHHAELRPGSAHRAEGPSSGAGREQVRASSAAGWATRGVGYSRSVWPPTNGTYMPPRGAPCGAQCAAPWCSP